MNRIRAIMMLIMHTELPIKNPESVISEVITFYEQRNLIPRFYIKNVDENLLFL
ncbi:hypothetical protein [Brevibacillus laterosporus]|uniref:hypothetical protein n=1 Tax=Brevibacillus laterosporus TaxID=1465 RepID=UPI002E1E4B3D|nr:hypothetical protein [Brevibacillus laterosporus]MED1669562.1 hypothetical protein [Brevibacillus laterosporus]MED1718039.1 hypothetical protein [Brevibacillus laterosporus]